jgi:phosphonate transport system substrate-binding protein
MEHRHRRAITWLAIAICLVAGLAAERDAAALQRLSLALTPSRDPTLLQEVGQELAQALSRHLGMPVRVQVASDYASVIEALRSQLVDAAFLPAVGYVLAARQAGARIVVKAMRGGLADYTARFFVRQDSPYQHLSDLRGKTIAFVDPASSSGYIYPMVLLIKQGLVRDRDPKTFFRETLFAGSHDAALLSLLNGSVDAAVTFAEAPERLLKEAEKIARLRSLAETPRIPNDGAAVRRDLSAEMIQRITQALLALNNPQDVPLLQRLYGIDGLAPAQDREYDPVREAVDLLGVR